MSKALEDLRTLYTLIQTGPPAFTIPPNSPHSEIIGAALMELGDLNGKLLAAVPALEFYADPHSYDEVPVPTFVSQDAGAKARQALVAITGS